MPNGSVQTLVRAFAILEAVGSASGGIRLRDISRTVELHSSTALRRLRTMAKLG
jgi:DNA-binding IclR family transcriptional regulator